MKSLEKITTKQVCVKGIITRLKPNTYIDKHHFWYVLSCGLKKMSVEEINALEALIMGKKLSDEQLAKEDEERFMS